MANLTDMSDAPNAGASPPEPPAAHGGLAAKIGWPLAVMVLAVCALVAFGLQQCSPAAQAQKLLAAGGNVAQGMAKLVAAINEHQVTESFVQHVDAMKPDLNGRLLVAQRETTEIFSTQDVSWHGTATAELRVPVTYHYYVALTGDWNLQIQTTSAGVVGVVTAPDLQALEPSINTSAMELKNANGWGNWNGPQLQDDLLKDLSTKLNQRAGMQLAQNFPTAHEAVEKFVRDWMLREYNLPPGTPVYLRVRFHNEPAPALETVAPPKG